MGKRTRMIVVTKGRIIGFFSLFTMTLVCVLLLALMSQPECSYAFSHYKTIIQSQILPADEPATYESSGEKLLKHIFKNLNFAVNLR